MVPREPEDQVQRIPVLGDVVHEVFADVLAAPALEVERLVVGRAQRVVRHLDAEPPAERLQTVAADLLAPELVGVLLVEQREEREERHLELLGPRQAGRVVQGDGPAVGHHAVDELELLRLGGQRPVPRVQGVGILLRQVGDDLVEDVVLVDRHDTEPPARAAEVLGEGVDEDRVVRQLRREGPESVDEGAVDVVGQQNQVGALLLDEPDQPVDALLLDRDRAGVRRIDDEERLDLRILELGDLRVGILPAVVALRSHPALLDRNDLELELLQVRNLEVGDENRSSQRDRVPLVENPVGHQRLEDVDHRGGAALDREEVVLSRDRPAPGHLAIEVLVHDSLHVRQHAIGNRIVVADHGVGQLPDEAVRVELQLGDTVVEGLAEKIRGGRAADLVEVRPEASRDARRLGHPRQADPRLVPGPTALAQAELEHEAEGLARCRGDPVRVAAAGVEHRHRSGLDRLVGQSAEVALQLEGAQLAQVGGRGRVRCRRHRAPFAASSGFAA